MTKAAAAVELPEFSGYSEVVHDLPGRARFKVRGLYKTQTLATFLSVRLEDLPGIQSCVANLQTSRLLVRFEPHNGWTALRLTKEIDRLVYDALVRLLDRESRHFEGEPGSQVEDDYAWHVAAHDDLLERAAVNPKVGLREDEVTKRRTRFGSNRLNSPPAPSPLQTLTRQFTNGPTTLLAGCAALSLITGGVSDAVLITAVVVTNGLIGFFTESQSEAIIRSMGKALPGAAIVLRDGAFREVSEEDVVVGDVLVLAQGNVAADARLIETRRLTVDESLLTGESMPVTKSAVPLNDPELPLADRSCIVYAGTTVTGGSGLAIVIATGAFTEVGKIHALVVGANTPTTPLQRDLDFVANRSISTSIWLCAAVFSIGLLHRRSMIELIKSSLALAVAAVPEGLAAVGTTTLAYGVREMEKRDTLVRRLDAVEALGAVEYFCLDKTGTLTTNQMRVADLWTLSQNSRGNGQSSGEPWVEASVDLYELLKVLALCNDSEPEIDDDESANGSATERALMHAAILGGVDVRSLLRSLPREATKTRTETIHFMRTFHRQDNRYFVAVKGSPSEILKRCSHALYEGNPKLLTEVDRHLIAKANEQMTEKAYRVLAAAFATSDVADDDGIDWTYCGLVGLKDPPRTGMKELIQAFHEIGIKTVMMTGDQAGTATALAQELQMSGKNDLRAIDAKEFTEASPERLRDWAESVHVFSRVNPSDKQKIVQALQRLGKVVAMTGDGVNDCPALRAADVGIAMGGAGTRAARESADVVLRTDDLTSLLDAIRLGRMIRESLKTSVEFQLATNASEMLTVLLALAIGHQESFSPKQLLWVNLVTDIFPALALSLGRPDHADLKSKPVRSGEPLFTRQAARRLLIDGMTLTASSLAPYCLLRKRNGHEQASTAALNALVASQMVYALSKAQVTTKGHRKLVQQYPLLLPAIGLAASGQGLGHLIPMLRRLLGITSIPASGWLAVLLGAALPGGLQTTLDLAAGSSYHWKR